MIENDDVRILHAMGYAQELSRRLGVFSNFAISFSIICILAGGITSYPLALATGGGFSATIGWLVGGAFSMIVACSLAQISSAYPTAGALYHWSSILGGTGWGWATAWANLIGLIFILASVDVGVYLLFNGLVAGPILGIDTSAWGFWPQTIAVAAIIASQALFNHFGIGVTKVLIDISGYLILIAAVVLTATFLYWGHGFDLSRVTHFVNNTGAAGGNFVPEPRPAIVAFLIGLLYPAYTILGFDASAHAAEETNDARRVVPRGMILSVAYSIVFGFFMACAFVFAGADPAATASDGGDSWFHLYRDLPAPFALKSVLAFAIVIANYFCGLATITSTSRMVFAFSRDGGLPGSRFWKHISPAHRSPVAAIWLTSGLGFAATLYSPAFAALAAGSALFMYVSYAMPVAAGLFAEGKSWTKFGPFRLGVWSKPFAVLTITGVAVLTYAGLQPPNDIVINYAIGLLVLLLALWFGFVRNRFKGPPVGAAIAARAAEITRLEEEIDDAVTST